MQHTFSKWQNTVSKGPLIACNSLYVSRTTSVCTPLCLPFSAIVSVLPAFSAVMLVYCSTRVVTCASWALIAAFCCATASGVFMADRLADE